MKKGVIWALLCGLAMFTGAPAWAAPPQAGEVSPALELKAPEGATAKYLGLAPGAKTFRLEQVKAQAVLVEGFSMYCTICQAEAPRVNESYSTLQQRGLGDKLKFLGLGAGNSEMEVGLFRDKFKRAFPLLLAGPASAQLFKDEIYQPGVLKPIDSKLKVKVGQPAPDFTLPSTKGEKNVVISFLPSAFTPVCSELWPGYNLAREVFTERDVVVLGLTVDNLGTLHAWTQGMGGLWFPVLSDFWPHGEVAQKYGVLRGDGMAERAIIVVDKKGVIRYLDVRDINTRPALTLLVRALDLITKEGPGRKPARRQPPAPAVAGRPGHTMNEPCRLPVKGRGNKYKNSCHCERSEATFLLILDRRDPS